MKPIEDESIYGSKPIHVSKKPIEKDYRNTFKKLSKR